MSSTPKQIRLAEPRFSETARQAVLRVMDSGHLVAGAETARFEQRLAELCERRFAVALSSGTSALMAGMHAMGIGVGSVVVVPAYCFPASAMAAAFLGATVRVCDVDPATWNMTPETLSRFLDAQRVDLVVPVDLFGMPAPSADLATLCSGRGVRLLVDAACSLGASLNGIAAGAFGDATIFSFHPRKIITTFEGGAFVTDDEALAIRVRRLRNLGHEDGDFVSAGINLRPSELGAACGVVQLEELPQRLARRSSLAAAYREALPLQFQESTPGAVSNHQSMVVRLPGQTGPDGRSALIDYLAAHGIEARSAGWTATRIAPLVRRFDFEDHRTPVASLLHETAVALPLHESLSIIDIRKVTDAVLQWLMSSGVRP